jgi:UDP-glucose 4-epimerase
VKASENPLLYYENNINALVIARIAENEQANFIFSSSCTVYGQAETMPINVHRFKLRCLMEIQTNRGGNHH